MRVVVVVVLDPPGERCQRGECIAQRRDADVIAFERVHECLGDAVGLRAADRREARFEPELPCKGERLAGGIGRAPFNKLRTGLSDSISTGVVARMPPERVSTACSMMSRMCEPLMPALATATPAMI